MDAHAHASVGHAELEIPYNVHPRPDTGLYNGKLGVWLFLASEVMLFGALFSSLILLRTGAESWPRGYEFLNVKLATFNTFILILSSVTVVMAWSHLRLGDLKKGRIYISATVFCALIFLTAKGFEYSHEFHEGRFPKTNNFLAIYFTMTGLHGLHILGGVIVFLYFLGPGAKMWLKEPERYTNRIEIVGLYWHFVDLVWIFLFPILYLM
jgi:heme/copper-type cytochrome/quinol oxidase subunit 3